MDKNTVLGFILIALVWIGYAWWTQPSAEQIAEQVQQDSIAAVEKKKADMAQKQQIKKVQTDMAAVEEDTTALFHSALKGTEEKVILQNGKLELTLSSKGAIVEKAVVKNYKDRNGKKDVTLFKGEDQKLSYILNTKEQNIDTQNLYFIATQKTDTTVVFTAQAAAGKTVEMAYQLGKNYMLHMQMRVKGMDGLFPANTTAMDVNWSDRCAQQEKGFTFENRYATLTYHEVQRGTDKLSETSEKINENISEQIDWVAFKNQFFSVVMIAKNNFEENSIMTSIPQEKDSGYLKQYNAKMKTFLDPTGKEASEFEFYYGPNNFQILQKAQKESTFGKDLEMTHLVYLGWWIFRIINRWFTMYIFEGLAALNIPMGIVLILITLILKVITYPMVRKSYMSSAKMRVLKPKLDAATKQFDGPEQSMQKQQAMMQEYAKYGVSPMAGCLPMLIQMPVWLAMFNYVPNAIQLRGQSFLWIKDLSTYDPIYEWSKNIWGIGDHISLTCILFCVGNLLYSWMTMKQQKDQMVGQQAEQMKMMQWMMMLMPLMFFFIFNDYSAGLNFYYFVSLFFSAAIMWALRRFTDDEKLLAKLEAYYKENKDSGKKLTGLAGRLQTMAEEQKRMEAMRRELEKKRKGMQ